jgi:hypothetical protein
MGASLPEVMGRSTTSMSPATAIDLSHAHLGGVGRGVSRRPVAARKGCHRLARGSPQEGLARIHPGAAAADRCHPSDHPATMPLRPPCRGQSTEPGASVPPLGHTASQ